MTMPCRLLFVLCLAATLVAAEPRREVLLAPSQGHVPSDTASEGATKFTIEDNATLGAKALKVSFAPGDTFGDRVARVTNWKPFEAIEFNALNPTAAPVPLKLVVRHGRSTNFATRVDLPIILAPGRNDLHLGLDGLTNNNGSAPDLANIVRWYIACAEGQSPTVYFGDIVLVGPEAAAPGSIKAAKMPAITAPVMFNTPEADAICAALEVFPADNPWNQLIDQWPLRANSRAIVASVGLDKPLRGNTDMGFIFVPPSQASIDVKLVDYPDESDKGPYPLPPGVPIEGWPASFRRDPALAAATLDEVQRDTRDQGGDRHASVVDPVNRMLYEFYQLKRTPTGWQAACAAIFDLKSNALRPTGWTSTDAAGLPIFPATVRYDELQRGVIDHALRVTVRRSQRGFVAPATHFASRLTDADLPRMGERFRLRADFDVSGFSPEARTILVALKRYGMFVADNGLEWCLSIAPDERIPVLHEELRKVKGSDFEVVEAPH